MRLLPLICIPFLFTLSAQAETVVQQARTYGNTLNELVGRFPNQVVPRERESRKLSAISELLVLHELKMRGEGLPSNLAVAFSSNYTAVISALVEDRIPEEYGRALLSFHRELLSKVYIKARNSQLDQNFSEAAIDSLSFYQGELDANAISLWDVPDSLRTPVINGYQVWVDELLSFGCDCGRLTPGNVSRLRLLADKLERFEGYYKVDGVMNTHEREQLHGRFLDVTKEMLEELGG